MGDVVETTGTGGIYPSGLYIGRVTEIEKDKDGISQRALVETGVDFETLKHVMVIKRDLSVPEVDE